jgi:hypothetical protein
VDREKFVNKFIEIIEDVLLKEDSIELVVFPSFQVKK